MVISEDKWLEVFSVIRLVVSVEKLEDGGFVEENLVVVLLTETFS